jgi:hypothetical protein
MKTMGSSLAKIVAMLFLSAVGCATAETPEGEMHASQPSPSAEPLASESAASAITWWEWRLNHCGKNTNCGSSVNFDEGFWDKRQCSCQSSACGAFSCGHGSQEALPAGAATIHN